MTMIEWTPTKKAVATCAAIGVGLLVVCSRRRWHEHNGAPVVLDPELDSDTRKAVLAALVQEGDPAVLRLFATKLDAAGFDESARVVRERAAQISHIHPVVPVPSAHAIPGTPLWHQWISQQHAGTQFMEGL